MQRLKKAAMIVLVGAWLTCGLLWYVADAYEPTYKLVRRPQAELNAMADDLLKQMEGRVQ